MYRVRTPGYSKKNQVQRWALPDRVFFACGACHILAYAFLERYGHRGQEDRGQAAALWIRPAAGHTGNHIVVATDTWVFDDHGDADRSRYLAHTRRRAGRFWPGWDATLVSLPRDVLVSDERSLGFAGLRQREPGQFLHDALPRARRFLDRFPAPDAAVLRGSAQCCPGYAASSTNGYGPSNAST